MADRFSIDASSYNPDAPAPSAPPVLDESDLQPLLDRQEKDKIFRGKYVKQLAHQKSGPCGINIVWCMMINIFQLAAAFIPMMVGIFRGRSLLAEELAASATVTGLCMIGAIMAVWKKSVWWCLVSAICSGLLFVATCTTACLLFRSHEKNDSMSSFQKAVQLYGVFAALMSTFDCVSYMNILKDEEQRQVQAIYSAGIAESTTMVPDNTGGDDRFSITQSNV